MQTYKVYEAVEKITTTGKKLKRLVLQREGAQHPTKNVTMWGDHPNYGTTLPGTDLVCDLLEKDSGTPNPNNPGKNYINRTVAQPGQTPVPFVQQTGSQNLVEMAIKTHIDQKFAALKMDLKIIADHLGVEAPKEENTLPGTGVPYPEGVGGTSADQDQINPEDIPF